MKGPVARKSTGRRARAVPVRIVHDSPEVARDRPYTPPKPRLYLEGAHAQAFLRRGKVGQRVTATIRGKLTELSTRHDSDTGQARHSATVEIDKTSC